MLWIVSADKEIWVDSAQLVARHKFIQEVSQSAVTDWREKIIDGDGLQQRIVCCESAEGINGVFITAHIGQVQHLCKYRPICNMDIIVANTCIWAPLAHKDLLRCISQYNRSAELWFAKQTLCRTPDLILHPSVELANVGLFGFQTSASERKMYQNRNLGLLPAIKESFDRVSPVLFPGEV